MQNIWQDFFFVLLSQEIARNIVNFQKSGFDDPLIGKSNLNTGEKRKLDANLTSLAPPPKETEIVQQKLYDSLPSPEDELGKWFEDFFRKKTFILFLFFFSLPRNQKTKGR